MGERDGPSFFDERFATLRIVQEELERRGYFLYPIEREHTEGLVTSPLLHKLRTQAKKRGFANVATKVMLTFSGYARDDREVYDIPEARAYWQALDAQLPELPALVAILPEVGYNGAGMHLTLLGEIDAVLHRPAVSGYDVHVRNADGIINDAIKRIQAAGRKYHLTDAMVSNVAEHFQRGARHRL